MNMQSTVNNCVLRKVGVTQRRDRGREFEGGKTETNSLDCQNSTSLDHRSQFTQAISQSGRQKTWVTQISTPFAKSNFKMRNLEFFWSVAVWGSSWLFPSYHLIVPYFERFTINRKFTKNILMTHFKRQFDGWIWVIACFDIDIKWMISSFPSGAWVLTMHFCRRSDFCSLIKFQIILDGLYGCFWASRNYYFSSNPNLLAVCSP